MALQGLLVVSGLTDILGAAIPLSSLQVRRRGPLFPTDWTGPLQDRPKAAFHTTQLADVKQSRLEGCLQC